MAIPILLFFIFLSVFILGYTAMPLFANRAVVIGERRAAPTFATKMERMLMKPDSKKMTGASLLAPVIGAIIGFIVFPPAIRLIGVIALFMIGFILPGFYAKMLISKRKEKFANQLVDALMIMSSSFRGGLSLVQAMEAVVEEMPEPIDQEFGMVLSENKMGVALDEAFNHLYKRMPSPALQQTITAILLARETGGNLPAIFTRIVNTIRENKKIQQNIDTLTLQGKIQGIVMSCLPIGFLIIVQSTKPDFLIHMMKSSLGRAMLIYSFFSEIIGAFFIWKISTFKNF